MTDEIYVGHQTKSRIGILLAVAGVLAVIGGIVFLVLHRGDNAARPEPDEM